MLYRKNELLTGFYEKYEDLGIDSLTIIDLRIAISLALLIFAAGIFSLAAYPLAVYKRAEENALKGEYDAALSDYETIIFYEDSAERLTQTLYDKGLYLLRKGYYDEASEIFITLSEEDYKGAKTHLKECNYALASLYYEEGNFEKAAGFFSALGEFKNSRLRYLSSVYYLIAKDYAEGRTGEGLSRLHILIDAGYFTYSCLSEPDHERAIELVRSTSVNLYSDFGSDSSEWEYYTGSGCVYKITPDFIYCLSAKHVLDILGGSSVTLTFFDGTAITGKPEYIDSPDERSDLCIFRIRTADIPLKLLYSLKEISFEPSFYEELIPGSSAFLYAAFWYGRETLITETEFTGFDAGALTEGVYDGDNYLVFRRASRNGQSGCPVFDDRGRCLAVSSGYYYKKDGEELIFTADCYCRLDRAAELYTSFITDTGQDENTGQ